MFYSSFRVNTSEDVLGVELAGALKNVLAIAAGVVEGLGLGHNTMAALVTQGLNEIRMLCETMGADVHTISGPAGAGDTMLTCFVNLSRNRKVGVRLGSGEKLTDILGSMKEVAEGVPTAGVVVRLARKYRVPAPVVTTVACILVSVISRLHRVDAQTANWIQEESITPREAVLKLMTFPQIEEKEQERLAQKKRKAPEVTS